MRHIPDWDRYFLSLLYWIADRSKDPDTQVGAAIVAPDKSILSTGYNSLPRGIKDVEARLVRPTKYQWIEHAERNAIYAATGRDLRKASIYSSLKPCMNCARGIVQTGIVEVVFDLSYQNSRESTQYTEEWKLVDELFAEAGVLMRGVKL